jgi:O-antigen/teichoic acid export membrane protein
MQSSSIIRNTSSLLAAHFAGRILSFVLIIALPRYLAGGFSDLGKYFVALWWANLLAMLTELGLHTPIIREVAADRSKAPQIISNALVIRLILSFITFLIVVVVVRLMYPAETASLIVIVGLSGIINALAQLFRYIFRSFERMGFEALGVILERSFVFSLGLCVVIMGYGVRSFCMVVLAASIMNLALTFFIMVWKFSRPSFKLLDMRLCIHILKQALPFALSGALTTIYFRIDGLMLKHIMGPGGDVALGWYGTGYGFITALVIIPGAFMGAVFPVMSRMLRSSQANDAQNVILNRAQRSEESSYTRDSAMDFLYTKSLKLMFIVALPIAVGMTFLADKIVLILYPIGVEHVTSQDQEALSQVLKILIWAGALMFLDIVLVNTFRAANKRRAFLIIMAVVLSVNIGSNLILIPGYGHLGAAVSMIVSELVFLSCGFWYVHRYVCKLMEFGFIFKSAFASGLLAMGLIVWGKYATGAGEIISVALVICLAIIAYFAVILALKGITREDIAMVRGQYPV